MNGKKKDTVDETLTPSISLSPLPAITAPAPTDTSDDAAGKGAGQEPPTIKVAAKINTNPDVTTSNPSDDQETEGEITVADAGAPVEDQSNAIAPQSTNDDFIYPLRTKKFELDNFLEEYYGTKENPTSRENIHKDLFILCKGHPEDLSRPYKLQNQEAAQMFIQKMPFSMYMDFRSRQIEQMQEQATQQLNDLQKRLNLIQTNPGQIPAELKDDGKKRQKGCPKWLNKQLWSKNSEEALKARIDYYKKITALFANVSISQQPDDPDAPIDPKTYYIKRRTADGQKTLVTINNSGAKNELTFKISSKLNDKEKQDAICIMLDQATRLRERSESTRMEISGYLGNPKMALKIYQSALLQGATPTISQATLTAWHDRSTDTSLSEQERAKYAEAIKFHDKYSAIAKNRKELKKLRQAINKQEILKELEPVNKASDEAEKIKNQQTSKNPVAPANPSGSSEQPPTVTPAPAHHRPK